MKFYDSDKSLKTDQLVGGFVVTPRIILENGPCFKYPVTGKFIDSEKYNLPTCKLMFTDIFDADKHEYVDILENDLLAFNIIENSIDRRRALNNAKPNERKDFDRREGDYEEVDLEKMMIQDVFCFLFSFKKITTSKVQKQSV